MWYNGRKHGSIFLVASEISSLFAKHSSVFIETCIGQITSYEVLESTSEVFSSKACLCPTTMQIEAVK